MSDDSAVKRVGMIAPPAWFNVCAAGLTDFARGVHVMTTQLRFPGGFGYTLHEIRGAAGEVEACAGSLAAAGADLVAQIGTPFSTVHGWRRGCELEQRIESRAGVPVDMMGLSVPRVPET